MSISTPYHKDHLRLAESLVEETHRKGGLAPIDLDRFWGDQEISKADPFGADIPQVPLDAILTGECVYEELGVEVDFWRYEHDQEWRIELNRAYNDMAEKIVGRRNLSEEWVDPSLVYPPRKQLYDLFEARNEWHDQSWWLLQSANTQDELETLLDRVEARLAPEVFRDFMLPDNWDTERERLMAEGVKPPIYRHQRGPVTFATSVFGPENLIFLINDNPDLAGRFSSVILKGMLALARLTHVEAGLTPETVPRAFGFADDNCCLLSPEMYELFGYPVLKGVFEAFCPDENDIRHQHSDSAMGHLLPILGRLNMTGLNLGPTVMVNEIRKHAPRAVIYGQLAPFTYCRNEEVNIVLEFLRDFEMTREKRGLAFATAGSINNGTRLTSMRLVMAAIQRYGRYDG
jgi:uroporphyrinogen decarboxylase